MKKSLECPKCNGRIIVHVKQMRLPQLMGTSIASMPIAVQPPRGFRMLHGLGSFETFICRACGYTEWYAGDPTSIVVDEKLGVRILDNTPKATLR